MVDGVTVPYQSAFHYIGKDIRAEIANVGIIIDCWSATIHLYFSFVQGAKNLLFPCFSIIDHYFASNDGPATAEQLSKHSLTSVPNYFFP